MLRWLRDALTTGSGPGPADAPSAALPDVGGVLDGRYLLTERVGSGGSAVVYRATDLTLERTVAIKIPLRREPPTLAANASPSCGSALRSEAASAIDLGHPYIARLYHYHRDPDNEYIVMEFVEGRNLAEWRAQLAGQRFPVGHVVAIGRCILEGLAHAHRHGVVHNDVKPQNVIMGPSGHIKLVDFGIAKLQRLDPQVGDAIVGTFAYLAPERARRQPSDRRADIYATGATLYALAHGAPPFGDQALRAMWGHIDQPLPASPHIPPDLFAVLAKAMAKDPDDRYPTALLFDDALSRVQIEDPTLPPRVEASLRPR